MYSTAPPDLANALARALACTLARALALQRLRCACIRLPLLVLPPRALHAAPLALLRLVARSDAGSLQV